MGFPENLARLQKEKGETNYKLAKALGVHQTTIANWHAGTIPYKPYLELLAKHYNTTVNALCNDENRPAQ